MATIKTFRKGTYVRYVGTDQRMKELWGNSQQQVLHKCGNMAVGYFPAYVCGSRHSQRYAVPISDLEIVTR